MPSSPPGSSAWRLEEAPRSLSVVLDGELCLLSRRAFEPALRAIERRQPLMLLDLRGIRFFDCSGVGLLVEAARRAREDRRALRIVPSATVTRVLALLRLVPALPLAASGAREPGPGGRSARGAHPRLVLRSGR